MIKINLLVQLIGLLTTKKINIMGETNVEKIKKHYSWSNNSEIINNIYIFRN